MFTGTEYTAVIGTIGWALAVVALIVKTDWNAGPGRLRRRFTFLYDLLVLSFISITFVFAISITFPALSRIENSLKSLSQSEEESAKTRNEELQNLNEVGRALGSLVQSEMESKNEIARLADALVYFSKSTKENFEELCKNVDSSFTLPEAIEAELGLNDGVQEFSIKFDDLSASCKPEGEHFYCKCN